MSRSRSSLGFPRPRTHHQHGIQNTEYIIQNAILSFIDPLIADPLLLLLARPIVARQLG